MSRILIAPSLSCRASMINACKAYRPFCETFMFQDSPNPLVNIIPYGNYRHNAYTGHGNSIAIPITNGTTLKPLLPADLELGSQWNTVRVCAKVFPPASL